MNPDFLEPGRLWLLLIVATLAVFYVAVLRWRSTTSIRFTQIDLLDEIAPERPNWRRHVVAVLQLVGLAAAVVAIARPVDSATERTQSEGRILVAFDVSLSMEADDVDPSRF
jgi:Ca-activated chloride channel family protein